MATRDSASGVQLSISELDCEEEADWGGQDGECCAYESLLVSKFWIGQPLFTGV